MDSIVNPSCTFRLTVLGGVAHVGQMAMVRVKGREIFMRECCANCSEVADRRRPAVYWAGAD